MRLHAIFTLPGVRRHIFDNEIIPPERTAAVVEKSVALFQDRGLGLWIAERGALSIGFGGFWFSLVPRNAFSMGVGLSTDPPSMGRAWFPCWDWPDAVTVSLPI